MTPAPDKAFATKLLRIVVVMLAYISLAGGVWAAEINDRQLKGDYLFSPRLSYLHYCSPCHGVEGKGDGRYYVTSLPPKPTDLTDSMMAKKGLGRSDDYLFKWISQGSAAMGKSNLCPPWGQTLEPGHISGIIKFIKRQPQAVVAKRK